MLFSKKYLALLLFLAFQYNLNATPNFIVNLNNCTPQLQSTIKNSVENILFTKEDLDIEIRDLDYDNAEELAKASQLMSVNFKRDTYSTLPQDVINLYLEANSPSNLYETMTKQGTMAFIVAKEAELLGIVIARYNYENNKKINLQIRRLHTSLKATGYKGIGKTLVTICALIAKENGVNTLMTTASLPAKSFFENLGWSGNIIETLYRSVNSDNIQLPQFKCTFDIPDNFQGF